MLFWFTVCCHKPVSVAVHVQIQPNHFVNMFSEYGIDFSSTPTRSRFSTLLNNGDIVASWSHWKSTWWWSGWIYSTIHALRDNSQTEESTDAIFEIGKRRLMCLMLLEKKCCLTLNKPNYNHLVASFSYIYCQNRLLPPGDRVRKDTIGKSFT